MADNGAHLTNQRVASRVAQDDAVREQEGMAEDLVVAGAFSAAGTFSAVGKASTPNLSLGAAATPTIASGVLAVTSSHVNPLPESSTSDTVDSITKVGQTGGDLLLIHVPATNTITFDNSATMLLGAATRAVAPGGSLLLIAVSTTVWHEVSFLAAAS